MMMMRRMRKMNVMRRMQEEKVEKKNDILTLEEKEQKARDATLGRILTDEDFRKIAAAQLRKQVEGVRKVQKRGTKRKAQDDDEDESLVQGRQELVNLDDIELDHEDESLVQGR